MANCFNSKIMDLIEQFHIIYKLNWTIQELFNSCCSAPEDRTASIHTSWNNIERLWHHRIHPTFFAGFALTQLGPITHGSYRRATALHAARRRRIELSLYI